MSSRLFTGAVATLAGLAAVFCIWTGATASSPDLPIHASGQWRSDATGAGAWQADLAMLGNRLNGVMSVSGRPDLGRAPVSGHVFGNTIELIVGQSGSHVASFSGSLSGPALVGRYQTPSGDRGVWAGSWMSSPPAIPDQLPNTTLVGPQPPLLEWDPATWQEEPPMIRIAHQAGTTGPSTQAPTIGSDVLVNNPNDGTDGASVQDEPEVAVDRVTNPNRLLAAAIDHSAPGGLYGRLAYYFSSDGGTTWPTRGIIPGQELNAFQQGTDPSVDFDAGGHAFYAGAGTTGSGVGSSAVFVARSLDGGQTFSNAVQVAPPAPGITNDKPWVAADKVAGSPNIGNAYVAWTKIGVPNSPPQIWLAVSSDNGAHFGAGGDVSLGSQNVGGEFVSIAVGIDGAVNLAWLRPPIYMYSGHCPVTSGVPSCDPLVRLASDISQLPVYLPNLPGMRVFTIPSLAIDTAPGGSGYMAMVWADYRSGNADVYYTAADNKGQSWRTPVAIAFESLDEFMPTITIDDNHLQHVVYYKRTSQQTNTFYVFEITSGNLSGSFTAPIQLNDGGAIAPTGDFTGSDFNFMGDYIGIDSGGSGAVRHPVWTDSRRLKPGSGAHQQDIYTTTVSGC